MEIPNLKNIRIFRKKIGWSQQELAKEVGVGQSYIAKIEQGKQNPSYDIVQQIFTVLREEIIKLDKNPMIIRNVATIGKDLVFLTPYQTFKDVKAKIGGFDQLPVIEHDQCVGSITTQQIIKLLSNNNPDTSVIKNIMGPPLPSFSETTPINQMRDILRYLDAAVIVKKSKVIGIITRSDIF